MESLCVLRLGQFSCWRGWEGHNIHDIEHMDGEAIDSTYVRSIGRNQLVQDPPSSLSPVGKTHHPPIPDAEKAAGDLADVLCDRPDLVGRWALIRNEGDMEAFAVDSGVSLAIGKTTASWDIGNVVQSIEANEDRFTITEEGPKGSFAQELVINGCRQNTIMLTTGEATTATPFWDGNSLVIEYPQAVVRRTMVGEELVVESVTCKTQIRIWQYMSRSSEQPNIQSAFPSSPLPTLLGQTSEVGQRPGTKEELAVRSDLSGRWKLVQNEGDMEAFAVDAGVSWALRKLATKLDWGVGKIVHVIVAKGDSLTITASTPRGTYVQKLVVNGQSQSTMSLGSGEATIVLPYWDGDSLVVESRIAFVRRRIVGEQLVMESVTRKNTVKIQQSFSISS